MLRLSPLVLLTLGLLASSWAHAASVPRSYFEKPLRSKRGALKRCYDAALRRTPDLPDGQITIRYTIEADGSVTTVSTTRNDTGDAKLARCERAVFLSLHYQPAPHEPATVTYPLRFKH